MDRTLSWGAESAASAGEISHPEREEGCRHGTAHTLSLCLTSGPEQCQAGNVSTPKQEYPESYRRLQAELAKTGWVALGSVVERGQPGQGGPRYQWSRRVGKKTVTVALSREQFDWMSQAIQRNRKAWEILEQMHQLSLEFMWKNLPSTSRRKSLTKKTLGLN